jgi:hypothetical protein
MMNTSLFKQAFFTSLTIAFVVCASLAGVFTWPQTASAAATCTIDQVRDHLAFDKEITINIDVDSRHQAIATVTNNSDCAFDSSFIGYKVFNQELATQKYFDGTDTRLVAPGKTETFTIGLPGCMTQMDVYYGTGPHSISSEVGPEITLAYAFDLNQTNWYATAAGEFCTEPEPTPDLTVQCVASDTSVEPGDAVTYQANPQGGNGSYSYSWSGSDNLSSSNKSTAITYTSTGTKTATVTVTSDGQTASDDCEVAVTRQAVNLTASCRANVSSAEPGEKVTFTTDVSGGSGSYTYEWSGSDDLTGNRDTVTKSYDDEGNKNAHVIVRSGSESVVANCDVNIDEPSIDVGGGSHSHHSSNNNKDLDAQCKALTDDPVVGQVVTWDVDVDDSEGHIDYDWESDEGFTSDESRFRTTYNTPGRKEVKVTVEDKNDEVTDSCSVNVGQVLGAGVSLVNVPYTGVSDTAKTTLFFLSVMSLALGFGYWHTRRKKLA